MTPHHHPGDLTLIDYGAGRLSEAMALAVATHLALCRKCRPRAAQIDAMGGILLEELAPISLSPGTLEQVLAKIDERSPDAQPSAPPPSAAQLAWPVPLRPYLAAGPQHWRFLAPGVRQIRLSSAHAGAGSARLLRVAPGRVLAHHGHHGREMSVVITGAYADEFGRFGPGDFAELDETMEHRPVAAPGGICVCLIATDGRLRFDGWIGRLLQPLIGV